MRPGIALGNFSERTRGRVRRLEPQEKSLSMILYLVRHGETAHNRDGIGFGREDVPLTPMGRSQAARAADRLAAEAQLEIVITSPLSRARDTASEVARLASAPLVVDERLLELSVGDLEGLPISSVRERFPGLLENWAGPGGHDVRLPGGESISDLSVRIESFRADLATQDVEHVAVVAHNFVLRVVLCNLLGIGAARYRGVSVELASISVVHIRPEGRTSITRLNDTCHLRGLDS